MCSAHDCPPYEGDVYFDPAVTTCDECGSSTDHHHDVPFDFAPPPTVYFLDLPVIDGTVWTADDRTYAAPPGVTTFVAVYPDDGATLDELRHGLGDRSWEASTRWSAALRGGRALFHPTQMELGLES